MREYDGTGIAAPQVFTPLRVFLYEVHPEKRKRKEPEVPLTALLQRELRAGRRRSGKRTPRDASRSRSSGEASCRASRRSACAPLDRSGKPVAFEASGYHARVLQHEIDHLDGLVYLDRMPDMKSLAYTVNFG